MQVTEWLGADNKIGLDIWEKKYRHNGESFDDWLYRVSAKNNEICQLIIEKKFLFGGRILANRGVKGNRTYSNCYVIAPPEDNLESIFETAKKLARTYSYGGGCGLDLGKLAPKGAKVNNAAKESSGACSFMELFDMVTGLISQRGRRGALMVSMPINHPDIEDFITSKSDVSKINNANISVRVSDEFMKAVEGNKEFVLSFTRNETGEIIEKTVRAKELFHKLCESNWDYAEPGILFWDRIRNHNLLQYDENFEYAGVNPCVTGDTLIQTVNGNIPIKDLVGQQPEVYCMGENGNIEIHKASRVWKTRENAKLVKVNTYRGSLRCTPDHKICTRNRGWVKAQDLKRGDKLVGLNRQMKDETHVAVGLAGGNYIPEHRLIASYFYDIVDKDVHHIDGNTLNNIISNLEVLEHGEHSRISNTGRKIDVIRDSLGRYVEKECKAKRKSFNLNSGKGTNWTVRSVELIEEQADVYDMTVPIVHNFIANRIVVHNCAEEPLPVGGSCLLGAINLSEFVLNPFTSLAEVDWLGLASAVNCGVKALNQVLSEGLELHPLEEQRRSVATWRQIGLGIMGLSDMLVKLGITYGSEEAINLCESLARSIFTYAYTTSTQLGKQLGSYPMFDEKAVTSSDMIKAFNRATLGQEVESGYLKNSQLLTIAPTGTLSTMLGVSGGIEPIFAKHYTRKTKSLHGEDVEYTIDTPIVSKYKSYTNNQNEVLPEYFKTALEIEPEARVKMQAVWQKWIDAGISSTVNLPNNATVKDVETIYLEAWKQGLKGITIYRAGCAREGILTVDTPNKAEPNHLIDGRGQVLPSSDNLIGRKKKLITGCGSLHCLAFFDSDTKELRETYLSRGSSGGCNNFMNGLSRMISLSARAGVGLEDILDQLNSCGVCPSYANRKSIKGDVSPGSCCPIAVGKALKEMYDDLNGNSARDSVPNENVQTTNPKCPDCDEDLAFEGGCVICKSCGYSKCN